MFLSPILWVTAVTTIRAAIISLYIRIFPSHSFLAICYVVLAVNVVFGVSAVIADCVICWPITYRWAPSTVDGSCGDQHLLDMFIAVVNLVQDVVVVVLPMPVLYGLKSARDKRVGLYCMFGIGLPYVFLGLLASPDWRAGSTDMLQSAASVPLPCTASRLPPPSAIRRICMRRNHTAISRS